MRRLGMLLVAGVVAGLFVSSDAQACHKKKCAEPCDGSWRPCARAGGGVCDACALPGAGPLRAGVRAGPEEEVRVVRRMAAVSLAA